VHEILLRLAKFNPRTTYRVSPFITCSLSRDFLSDIKANVSIDDLKRGFEARLRSEASRASSSVSRRSD